MNATLQAYTPLPKAGPVAPRRAPLVGIAAVLAAGGWWLSRDAAPVPAAVPPTPGLAAATLAIPASLDVPRPVAAPAPSAALSLVAMQNAPTSTSGELLAAAGGAALPAWARATPEVRWSWPARVAAFASQAFVGGHQPARREGISRRVSGWFPQNPEGRQVQLSVIGEDGVEKTIYEDELPGFEDEQRRVSMARMLARMMPMLAAQVAHGAAQTLVEVRAKELEALRVQKDAVAARGYLDAKGLPMAEMTYKDGHKETMRYDPIVFDLKGRGVQTDARRVLFDLYGYRKADKVQWMNDVGDDMGILVFDNDGSGTSGKTGAEVFGDRTDLDGAGHATGFADGFEALRALVDKAVRQGVLEADAARSGVLDAAALAKLEKAYGLKMKVGGFNKPAISLAQAGVTAIALSRQAPRRVQDFDGRGNDVLMQPGAVFLRPDGSSGSYMNVWLSAKTGGLGLEAR